MRRFRDPDGECGGLGTSPSASSNAAKPLQFRCVRHSAMVPTLSYLSVPSPRSACLVFHVMPEVRHLSAPRVMVALAGAVHDRETAAHHEHYRGKNNR
jgi:hypothetical protein